MNTVYIGPHLEVTVNDSGEVFVKNTKNGVTIRISDTYEGMIVSTQERMRPFHVNGLDAFRVTK